MHKNSRLIFEKLAKKYFQPGWRVLEVGPDRFPSTYRTIVNIESLVWETINIFDDASLTYRANSNYDFPLDGESFDVVLSGQVIEHVPDIYAWMRELSRVCKQGGLVITICPVSWPFHKAPIDCWRVYPDGMKVIYDQASMDVIESYWGTFEARLYRHRIPGRSFEWQPKIYRLVNRGMGVFGYPVECAYDSLTVGRKRFDK